MHQVRQQRTRAVLFAWLKILFSICTCCCTWCRAVIGCTLLCSCALARDNSSVTGRLCLLVVELISDLQDVMKAVAPYIVCCTAAVIWTKCCIVCCTYARVDRVLPSKRVSLSMCQSSSKQELLKCAMISCTIKLCSSLLFPSTTTCIQELRDAPLLAPHARTSMACSIFVAS